MAYNWGNERRRGTDRREGRHDAYGGPERRVGDRRKSARERPNWLSLALTAFVLFLVVDWVAWDGYYRHGFFARLNRQAQIWTEETGHF